MTLHQSSVTHHVNRMQDRPAAEMKRHLRTKARGLRDALDIQQRRVADDAILAHVLALLPRLPGRQDKLGHRARGVALYSSIGSEVNTRPLIVELTRRGLPIALPRVCSGAGERRLSFVIADARTPLVTSAQGISEPDATGPFDHAFFERLLAAFVPLLAFDAMGHRLGYGAGLYDRALASFQGHIIGLGYAAQRHEALPAEPHDVRLHAMVTEDGLVIPEQSPLKGLCPS